MEGKAAMGCGVTSTLPDASFGSWFVLRTKSRQEKILAGELAAASIGCFLPLVSSVRYYAGKKVTVEAPLFPGYLFLRGEIDDAYFADRGKRVAQIIRVSDQARIDRELSGLHIALCANATLNPYPYLKRGVSVAVKAGPLMGLTGKIEDISKRNRLILQVQLLGQASFLEIDGSLLEVIDDKELNSGGGIVLPDAPRRFVDAGGISR
jgi:transcriptional antiterminator RfaH